MTALGALAGWQSDCLGVIVRAALERREASLYVRAGAAAWLSDVHAPRAITIDSAELVVIDDARSTDVVDIVAALKPQARAILVLADADASYRAPLSLSEVATFEHWLLTPTDAFALAGAAASTLLEESSNAVPPRALLIVTKRPAFAVDVSLPPDLSSDVLTIPAYRSLLLRAKERGYRFVSFDDVLRGSSLPDGKLLLLRHDVDLSPELAHRVAQLESQLSVRSTYFVMISGAFYNVFEPRHTRAVRAIAGLGHDIGLHYDEHDDILDGLSLLSIVAARPLRSIAQHNPTILPRRGIDDATLVDAYDRRITGELGFTYVSDSGMKWRSKSVLDLVEEDCPRIYALCHPESWFADGRDFVGLIRSVEEGEANAMRERYDAFVAGNVGYLRKRAANEKPRG